MKAGLQELTKQLGNVSQACKMIAKAETASTDSKSVFTGIHIREPPGIIRQRQSTSAIDPSRRGGNGPVPSVGK